jgi:hypothetical protein
MSEKIYTAARAWIGRERYETLYRESIEQPEAFWRKQAERLVTAIVSKPPADRDANRPHNPVSLPKRFSATMTGKP